jgi:hypothetical protein
MHEKHPVETMREKLPCKKRTRSDTYQNQHGDAWFGQFNEITHHGRFTPRLSNGVCGPGDSG